MLRLFLLACCATTLLAQNPPRLAVAPAAEVQASLTHALTGSWTGTFEFPGDEGSGASLPHTLVPAWLKVTPAGNDLILHFTYDEGPGRVSDQTLTITLDVAGRTFSITNAKGHKEIYRVEGYESLHDGYGGLLLSGPSIDPHRPAGTHINLSIHRSLFTWSEETRPGPTVPFAFRHRYAFTRAQPPAR